MDEKQSTAVAAGQTWLPTKAGTGWRYVCKAENGFVSYRIKSGAVRRQWDWAFQDWCQRFDCFLAPKDHQP